jgi:NAD(P)-dependent dehydrogenase (short-subunit alcohol dehydrogenase family)
MSAPYALTNDGFERHWQVNYVAPHVFTSFLMPLLLSTASTHGSKDRVRVVYVTSDMAFIGPDLNLKDPSLPHLTGMFAP